MNDAVTDVASGDALPQENAGTGGATAVAKPSRTGTARGRWFDDPARLGFLGALLVAIGSYGAGATRYRGGVVDALGLGWITYGHGFALFETLIWIGIIVLLGGWLLAGRQLI
ncbi:MAG TPA: hypothetical protein K8V57_00590, partial [Corynebacterium xerosis]|nr:hypothetical protein [Corynebacterium xerosis]